MKYSMQSLGEAYEECVKKALLFRKERISTRKVAAQLETAGEYRKNAELLTKEQQWNSGFTLYYDALHTLSEALAALDKVKSYNHQCFFAHLCTAHPGLKLDWELLERVRNMRNRLQ